MPQNANRRPIEDTSTNETKQNPEMGKLLSFDGSEIPEEAARSPFNYFKKRMMMRAAQSRLKNGNAFKVFDSIVDFANSFTGVAWPALSTIVKDTCLSEKVVRKALTAIEEAGVCEIQWSDGGHHGETHRFRPRWHLATEYEQQQQKRAAEKRAGRVPKWDDTGAQTGNDGCPNGLGRVPKREPNPYDDPCEIIPLKDPSGQKQDEAEAIAPPPVPACSIDDQKRKPSGWEQPDWDDEFPGFLDRFNHETFREPGEGSNWQGAFCGIRKSGFTVDDMLVALEHDTKVSNPYGAPRSLPSFFANYFGEGATKADVEGWRKALPRSKSTPVMMKAPAEPRLSTTSDASRSNSYGLTPSMKRERELAYGSANHHEVEVPF